MCGRAFLHLNDVVAVLRLDDLCVADLLGEDGTVKLRHHVAALRKAEFAAGVLAAGVVRILLCQIGEVGAALDLLQEPLSLGLRRSIRLGVGAGSDLDQDVTRFCLLRRCVFRSGGRCSTAEFPAAWAAARRPARHSA